MSKIWKLASSVVLPLAVGGMAGYFTSSSVNTWFTTLSKPVFNPPAWLFAPVWTTLYILMGTAFFIIWTTKAARSLKHKAMFFYFVQLVLNFLWSFIFFYAKEIGWALVDIGLLWLMILITIIYFSKISKSAAWLLVPYIAWVSFATVLNLALWRLN